MRPQRKNIKYCCLIYILIAVNISYSQSYKNDTIKIKNLINLGETIFFIKPDSAFVCYKNSLQLAKKEGNSKFEAESLLKIGQYYNYVEQHKKSLEFYLKAIEVYKSVNDRLGIAECYSSIGFSFQYLNSLDKSIEYYLKALEIYKKLDYKLGVGDVYNGLGNINYDQENYIKAIEYFVKAIDLFEKVKNKEGLLSTYINIGNAIADDGDIDGGIDYYNKSIELSKELNDKEGLAINFINIADCFLVKKEPNTALIYLDKSLDIVIKNDYKSLYVTVYEFYAKTYLQLKNYKKTIYYSEKSLENSKNLSWMKPQYENNSYLSEAYAGLGDFKKAYFYHRLFKQNSDSIFNAKKFEQVAKLDVLYELENQEKRIASLTQNESIRLLELKNQKTRTYVLLSFCSFFLILIFLLNKRRKEKSKAYNLLAIEKERAEESEALYSGIFNNSTIGLYQTTPTGEILSVNNAIIKMLKFDSLEDLLQRDLKIGGYVNENKRIQFKTILQEKGRITDFESEWYTKNGGIITILEGAKAIKNAKGEITRYEGAVQDITDKKKIQTKLIESLEKAEESDRLKSAFLANMSHEIRTPMNAILGFSDILKDPELSIEKRIRFVDVINKSGKRLMTIINDIIDISKIESNQLKVDLNEINIAETLSEIIEIQKESNVLLAKNKIKIKLNLPVDQGYNNIKTDENRFIQIFNNLINNASKFTENGSIEIGYNLRKNSDNSMMEFYVKDTGCGIPKDKFEEVFNRFSQVNGNSFNEGNGLGLSICRGLLNNLGGNIWVESEVDTGSIFYFNLKY